jgi:hypothetical protein
MIHDVASPLNPTITKERLDIRQGRHAKNLRALLQKFPQLGFGATSVVMALGFP